MASEKQQTGACRFCGQNQIITCEDNLTEPQLEEEATRQCECDDAQAYQAAVNRRQIAKQRVSELFGEGAGEYKQPEAVTQQILQAVDLICDKVAKEITVKIRTGLKARVMQMAKDKIKVVREASNTDAFES